MSVGGDQPHQLPLSVCRFHQNSVERLAIDVNSCTADLEPNRNDSFCDTANVLLDGVLEIHVCETARNGLPVMSQLELFHVKIAVSRAAGGFSRAK